jgi:hypothetical protein
LTALVAAGALAAEPWQISGIYPHLATFNEENECGTGAVVPWADRLWVTTYAPHAPTGSTDKLYEIDSQLRQTIRPESIGGTPANRMIHRESQQLFIGPYAIDRDRRVRVIAYTNMFGRPTGNARHLTDPAGKVYCASMEEGLYEIDVRTLAVTELWADEQKTSGRHANLPGYHGKGLYSGQGWLIYANNGEHGPEALKRPETPAGVLAQWDGRSAAWEVVRRNQFTEVTGPGGLYGNDDPARDPVWSIGWDHRSLILMVLDQGRWHSFRLPKSSHSYDGAHGWNTEWPRIRDIGEDDLLMTMHGAFWRFPRGFRSGHSTGVAPRSNYLKVIGDFARWGDRVVFGCDDTAKAEFLNTRRAKGKIAAPQSQSNLWFVEPTQLDDFGPVIGRGGLWVAEDVPAQSTTEPFLACGYDERWLHLAHSGTVPATVVLEWDLNGTGTWETGRSIVLPPGGYQALRLTESGSWLRLRSPGRLVGATAWFSYANRDRRASAPQPLFADLAGPEARAYSAGLLLARAGNRQTLGFAASVVDNSGARQAGYYELDGQLTLRQTQDPASMEYLKQQAAIPVGVLTEDEASMVFVDDQGKRWRLPKGDPRLSVTGPLGPVRADREVATERDLFNCAGTFYELPAENAGGFAKIRALATHNRRIHDYCSFRGLLVLSGVAVSAPHDNPHIVRSDDGRVALWVGAIDDVWQLGKPRGQGGPWQNTQVQAGQASDPCLLTGFDRKRLRLAHAQPGPVVFRVEVDLTGDGLWQTYQAFTVPPAKVIEHELPRGYGGCWLRVTASESGSATAQLSYE